MEWLKNRLKEKSTITAFIGLASVSLLYLDIPHDVINAIAGCLTAILVTSATTEG